MHLHQGGDRLGKIALDLKKMDKENYTKKQHHESNYGNWRSFRSNLNKPFMMIPVEINGYASSVRSRALSLYMYYCYRAGNNTGSSWPAIETIAADLGVSPRSINNWNIELETLGLITRINEGRNSKTTYLLPISSYSYFENNISPEKILDLYNEKIDGKLVAIFHLFQWRKDKNKTVYNEPYNVTCIVFQRRHTPDETNNDKKEFVITKAIMFEEEEFKDKKLDKASEEFSEDNKVFIFETEARSYAINVEVDGIAVTNKINLKETKKSDEVIDFIEQLVEAKSEDLLKKIPTAELL